MYNDGVRQGYREAFHSVMDHEAIPRPYTFTYRGRRHTERINGRQVLRSLYHWRGRDIARGILEELNRRRRQHGLGDLPLTR